MTLTFNQKNNWFQKWRTIRELRVKNLQKNLWSALCMIYNVHTWRVKYEINIHKGQTPRSGVILRSHCSVYGNLYLQCLRPERVHVFGMAGIGFKTTIAWIFGIYSNSNLATSVLI